MAQQGGHESKEVPIGVGDAGFEPASTGSKPVRISRLP